MKYKGGYKYKLEKVFSINVNIFQSCRGTTDLLWLKENGHLRIRKGYCWDGPSGPVVDRSTNMRASLCHDALYQLMRQGKLPHSDWRKADKEFAKLLKRLPPLFVAGLADAAEQF